MKQLAYYSYLELFYYVGLVINLKPQAARILSASGINAARKGELTRNLQPSNYSSVLKMLERFLFSSEWCYRQNPFIKLLIKIVFLALIKLQGLFLFE